MTGRIPMRLRLTVWYSCVLFVALAAAGWGAWVAARHSLVASVDRTLRDRSDEIGNVLRNAASERRVFNEHAAADEVTEYAGEAAGSELLQVRGPDGKLLVSAKVSQQAAAFPWPLVHDSGIRDFRLHASHYRVLVRPLDIAGRTYRVMTASALDGIDDSLEELGLLLLIMLPVVAVLASIGGYCISHRALAPVASMAAAAEAISIQNLSQRLPVPPAKDELQLLASTWNATLSRLETAVNRLSQFTADASHELRSPLALIRTTTELALRRTRSAGEYREALVRVHGESERMSELVEDLLALARADAGITIFELSDTDLADVARQVGVRGEVLAGAKGIEFSTLIPDETIIVRGNAMALARLLLLLTDNAVKYTPRDGRVTLSVERQDGRVAAVVADTGVGIDPAALPRIFDRFYRADTVRAPGTAGAGLGLSLSKWIADEHNAEIQVISTPGEGSEFRVVFPQPASFREPSGNLQLRSIDSVQGQSPRS